MPSLSVPEIIEQLRAFYGAPDPPEVTDPWEVILWENVAYLVDDERRHKAVAVLRERIGVRPEQILSASPEKLSEVAGYGIVPGQNVEKLRRSAQIALEKFDGNLRPILKRSLAEAKKALKQFPGIGDPGAEKILLFGRAYPILALDSNGLRVLVRLGFGEEKPNYAATYRLVRETIETGITKEYSWLIKAHQLLRQHGQEVCKRSKPRCETCPLAAACPWPAANAAVSS
jgi:endonuclease-3